MPNGQFWYGKGGFAFKKSGGGGARRNPCIGLITGQDYNIYNKYVSGAGVGGLNASVRRAKMIRATSCNSTQRCGTFYKNVGIDRLTVSQYSNNND